MKIVQSKKQVLYVRTYSRYLMYKFTFNFVLNTLWKHNNLYMVGLSCTLCSDTISKEKCFSSVCFYNFALKIERLSKVIIFYQEMETQRWAKILLLINIKGFSAFFIPKSFIMNISHQLFYNKITFENTNSKGDFVLIPVLEVYFKGFW